MKSFSNYQYIGGPLNDRDALEVGSKYWNKGKWDNFILPLLPEDVKEHIFVDVGCNAGLFLKLAKDYGYRVIGIEPDEESYQRAVGFMKNEKNCLLIKGKAEETIKGLPVSDVTLFSNSHYYIPIDKWSGYVKELKNKTRQVIIVTAQKKANLKYAPSDIEGIRKSFSGWIENGFIDIPKDNTPHSRKMWSISFLNPELKRVLITDIDNGNAQQRGFLDELDKGKNPLKTRYYIRLKSYRSRTTSRQEVWSKEKIINFMYEKEKLYKDVKSFGLIDAVVIGKNNRLEDGCHRCEILRHIGEKSLIAKYE